MYLLVLSLPFNILMVNRTPHPSYDAALQVARDEYGVFPMDVWSADDVAQTKSHVIYFPFGG